VRFMHHQTYGFEAFFSGDSIAFINPQTLQPVGFAILKSAKMINKREMELEVAGNISEKIKTGLCIENLTWTPEVTIRNSRFERTNTRGILLTTRRTILVENNTFFKTGMHAILIGDDATSWFESGAVSDVTIRNNTFTDCGYNSAPGNFIIAIAPENHQLVPGYYVHRNIRIENNIFTIYDYPVVSARSVENLVFKGNKIIMTGSTEKGSPRPGFELTACKKVTFVKNTFKDYPNPEIHFQKMDKKEIKSDKGMILLK
jgi:hypothetical protein